jgi:3-deoxy-7-phosphoheptulonate synthase
MASGLSSAVGFKNGTDGNIEIAINALSSAALSNNFISVDPFGQVAIIRTTGNPYTHIILRGGRRPNYDPETVAKCEEMIKSAGFIPNIMIDCSHANSGKDPANQLVVLEDVTRQIESGNRSITGLMMESNLEWGNQPIPKDPEELKYGVSVTDACIDWGTTEEALRKMRDRIKNILPERIGSSFTAGSLTSP